MTVRKFWVLQWPLPDGAYYGIDDDQRIVHVADPMQAEMFSSLEQAARFHDSYDQLCEASMNAVEISITVSAGVYWPVPARARNTHDEK